MEGADLGRLLPQDEGPGRRPRRRLRVVHRDRLLPLDKAKLKRIAVLGPLADRIVTNNYNGKTGALVTALQGIKDRAGAGVAVDYEKSCDIIDGGTVSTKIVGAGRTSLPKR